MAVLLFVYRGTQKNLLLMQRVPGAPVFLLSRRTPPAACPFLIREKRPCSIMPSGADLHGLFCAGPHMEVCCWCSMRAALIVVYTSI